MKKIERAERGCIARNKKLNEVIDSLNPLLNLTIKQGDVSQPSIRYSFNNVVITIPEGGGAGSEYIEELFDVVLADNTAAQRYLLTKEVE